MPFFKVWDYRRERKIFVSAETLKELITKGSQKFGIDNPVVVLENDGTLIEDDEVLIAMSQEVLMLMADSSDWISSTVQNLSFTLGRNCANPLSPASSVSDLSSVSVVPQTPPEYYGDKAASRPTSPLAAASRPTSPSAAASRPTSPSAAASRPTSPSAAASRPTPAAFPNSHVRSSVDALPLPTFSELVKSYLANNDSKPVWTKMVAEAANYYFGKASSLSSSHEYRLIGRKMYQHFPCIKREGTEPWSEFNTCLSQKIRSMRLHFKRRSELPSSSASIKPKVPCSAQAKFQGKKSGLPIDHEKDETKTKAHIDELNSEFEKQSPNQSHLKLLLRETFTQRRTWIATLPSGKLAPIVEKYKCFKDVKWIGFEFMLLVGEECFSKITENYNDLRSVMKDRIPKEKLGQPLEMLAMIEEIEANTRFEKGKGSKSKPILEVISVPDAQVQKVLTNSTKEGTAPKLLVFTNEEKNEVKAVFVVADGISIACPRMKLHSCLIALISAYYTFDLAYPRIYSQLLGFIQQILLGEPFDLVRSRKFKEFTHEIGGKLSKLQSEKSQPDDTE